MDGYTSGVSHTCHSCNGSYWAGMVRFCLFVHNHIEFILSTQGTICFVPSFFLFLARKVIQFIEILLRCSSGGVCFFLEPWFESNGESLPRS